MGVFDSFYNFMTHMISVITSTPIIYIFMTVFVIWVFQLFFDIIRS